MKDDIDRKITIRGDIKLMRQGLKTILASHYPCSINPHNNSRQMNSIIKSGRLICIYKSILLE